MVLGMPHPSRITREAVIAAARALLEEEGPEALAMREVARRLGVRAPSLYGYVDGRDGLIRLLIARGLDELGEALVAATPADASAVDRVHAIADGYIDFAFRCPRLFTLALGPCPDEHVVDAVHGETASAPLMEAVALLTGEETRLNVAQSLWSLVHGYVTLELAGQFRLGGTPRAALHEMIALYCDALGDERGETTANTVNS